MIVQYYQMNNQPHNILFHNMAPYKNIDDTMIGTDDSSDSDDEDMPPLIKGGYDSDSDSDDEDWDDELISPPNRVVNMDSIQMLVCDHFTECDNCGTSTKYLDEDKTFGVASKMVVVCLTCNEEKKKCMNNIKYLKRKINVDRVACNKKGSPKKRTMQKMYYIKKKLNRFNRKPPNESPKENTTDTFLSNEVNLRSMLSTYYLGTGPVDIGNALSFLGLPGGHAYCTNYSRNMEEVN